MMVKPTAPKSGQIRLSNGLSILVLLSGRNSSGERIMDNSLRSEPIVISLYLAGFSLFSFLSNNPVRDFLNCSGWTPCMNRTLKRITSAKIVEHRRQNGATAERWNFIMPTCSPCLLLYVVFGVLLEVECVLRSLLYVKCYRIIFLTFQNAFC